MKSANGQDSTILIVEGIDWIRSVMKKAVESYGYHVAEATDDEEAISTAERVRPNLILTEEQLPTFGALTTRFREHPTLAHTSIVIVNPDEEEGTLFLGAIFIEDFSHLARVLAPPS